MPEPASEAPAILAPRFRGVLHEILLFLLPPAVIVLIVLAPAGARVPATVYGASLMACIGVSTLYHRRRWSPRAKRRMSKLDHSTIFLLIAGTFTPVAALALSGPLQTATEIGVWSGATIGITMSMIRDDWHPAVELAPYLLTPAMGWVAVPALFHSVGVAGTVLIIIGGSLYIIGALVYGRKWPNPWPRTFGYHEIFHAFVVAAAIIHFTAVLGWVDPLAA